MTGTIITSVRASVQKETPRFNYRVVSRETASQQAADMIMEVARTQQGTVLTPGCNTPLPMYKHLFLTGAQELSPLLRGEKGDFHLGMIDGVEWPLHHPYNFRHYLVQHFLGFFAFGRPQSIEDPEARMAQIDKTFSFYRNVYVPHITPEATIERKLAQVDEYNHWLMQRTPADLIVLGLGPDGHIAFLGPGEVHNEVEQPAKWVKLWEGLREWKWLKPSEEACRCVREGYNVEKEAPEYALTITLNTIFSARQILLLAFGQGKAEAVRRLLSGDPEPQRFTAHYLTRIRDKVTVLIDEPAAGLL